MNLQAHIEEGEREFARTWKNIGFAGLLAVAFGVVVLVWPNIGLTALIALFGAFAFVMGVTKLHAALDKSLPRSSRGWLVFDGLLGIAVAVVVLVWPDLSALALLYAIGAFAIATGILGVVGGATLVPASHGHSLLLMVWGVISIAFGAIMFAEPGTGALALLALIAAFSIVTGVIQIAYALELRHVALDAKKHLSPGSEEKPVLRNLHVKST
jgi:uncharacterized membrane protein HdeD (DUF308 family)